MLTGTSSTRFIKLQITFERSRGVARETGFKVDIWGFVRGQARDSGSSALDQTSAARAICAECQIMIGQPQRQEMVLGVQ